VQAYLAVPDIASARGMMVDFDSQEYRRSVANESRGGTGRPMDGRRECNQTAIPCPSDAVD
jgi:hypothetical protein